MSILHNIMQRAKASKKRIVLPEWQDKRILNAAHLITKDEIAQITLIGDPDKIRRESNGIDLEGISIIDQFEPSKIAFYAEKLYEMRKSKGLSLEKSKELLHNPVYFASMMLKFGEVDGLVAGAANCTADVWRPVLQIVKTKRETKIASSCFLMELKDKNYGENGVLFFADCALNPNPNAEQLAIIAISTADTAKRLFGLTPRVAMLSFSTYGSTSHELADKVIEATYLVKRMKPDLLVDGEIQVDAAIDAAVSQKKCPDSILGGKANILIFPDLQSGNIGYKLVQRLAGAAAIGPISQGLAKPVNDLSRGCSVQDIIGVTAITALEAINSNSEDAI